MNIKRCTKCKVEYNLNMFGKDKHKQDGKTCKCKYCNAKYMVWRNMVDRCTKPNDSQYSRYGKRGITVCDEWLTYQGMEAWIETYWVKDLQIDRIDNDKGYAPSNCRFTTCSNNYINRSVMGNTPYRGVHFNKKNNKYITKLTINSKSKYIGEYSNPITSAIMYDRYVIANNLPQSLNFKVCL